MSAIAAAVVLSSGSSQASWPAARHDFTRAGVAQGKGDMVTPIPYWRTYLGGSLGDYGLFSSDIDADGTDELLYVSGGRLVAKRPDDTGVWQTKPRGIGSILAVADLDGDGKLDFVTANRDHAYIVSAAGVVEWVEPDGEMGALGGVRVGDVDGDGKADLVVQECGCCGVNSGKTGFVYSFGAGFQAAKLLWTMPFVSCGGGRGLTLVDVDGNGSLEVMLAAFDHFELFDGKTGTQLGQTPVVSQWNSANFCKTQNIDGKPGDEIVCLLNDSDSPAVNQRRVNVLRYDTTAKTFGVLWSSVLAPDAGGDVRYNDPVVDLDGDGKYEVIASGFDPNGGWKTHIFDAMTGIDLVPGITGHAIAGSLEMATKGQRVMLTTAGSTVIGWTFARLPQPIVTQKWTIQDRSVPTFVRMDRAALYGANADLIAPDLNGDGLADLVLTTLSGPAGLAGYSGVGGNTALLGTRALPSGVDPLHVWILPAKSSSYPQVALARTDGFLELLDASLNVATTGGEIPRSLVIRIGGYYASGSWRELWDAPRTFPLKNGDPDAIVVNDSRGALLRFDAKNSSWASPPSPAWSKTHTVGPTIAPQLDGANPGIACYSLQEPVTATKKWQVQTLRADGSVVWTAAIESEPLGDLATAKLNSDNIPDLVAQWGDPSDVVLRTRGINGLDGSLLWNATPVSPGAGRQPAGVSIAKWDGDPFDDVYMQGPTTRVLSGVSGTQIGSGGSGDAYFLPIPYDTNADGVDEVILHAGYSPVRLVSHDLQTTLFASADDDRPYPYGAVAKCGTDTMLVEGSWQHSARLKLTPLSGASLGKFTTMVLAGGSKYPDETSANGQYLGQLTSASIHTDLTGKGRATAVVGSSDGFVYGVDPCTGNVDFAVDLKVAVGEVVFGDTDGDGRDEMLVSAADGYLYDLKNKNIDAPTNVIDTDPDHGVMTVDVDNIVTVDKLSGAWSAVQGATGYEVAVSDSNGKIISTPAWTNVGASTAASISGLPLDVGKRYFWAVRALSAAGPSVDAVSNGVTVISKTINGEPSGVDGGADGGAASTPGDTGGCGCTTFGGNASSAGALFGMLAIAIAARRRRRR